MHNLPPIYRIHAESSNQSKNMTIECQHEAPSNRVDKSNENIGVMISCIGQRTTLMLEGILIGRHRMQRTYRPDIRVLEHDLE